MKFRIYYSPYTKKYVIYKPLLEINRKHITKYLSFWHYPIVVDKTNRLVYFQRNRIRVFIMPLLRYFFYKTLDQKLKLFLQFRNQEEFYFKRLQKQILLNILYNNKLYILMPKTLQNLLIKQWFFYSQKSFSYKEINYIREHLKKHSKAFLTKN